MRVLAGVSVEVTRVWESGKSAPRRAPAGSIRIDHSGITNQEPRRTAEEAHCAPRCPDGGCIYPIMIMEYKNTKYERAARYAGPGKGNSDGNLPFAIKRLDLGGIKDCVCGVSG